MTLPKDGQFYATATLLGSAEFDKDGNLIRTTDRNRRTVYRWPDFKPVLHMNYHMDEWSKIDEARLQIILTALNKSGEV